ncbi:MULTISPECIES: hypothetical protein [unclassified Wolbachia]|nr:hypothetical protein [Wolbachia endosymbiont of Ceratitis capitata]MBS9529756.1 hypothetical protein [Wolbachia endosymbiont of Ceratitis capitata]
MRLRQGWIPDWNDIILFGIPVQLLASANCNVRTDVGAKFYKHRCAEP